MRRRNRNKHHRSGAAGLTPDQILILISSRDLQLDILTGALDEAELPYETPTGQALTNDDVLRSAYCIFRILQGVAANRPDYMAHRALLSTMVGVGIGTQVQIAELCIQNHQNFHDLFYLAQTPAWLPKRSANAVGRVKALLQALHGWNLDDTLADRAADLADLMSQHLFDKAGNAEAACVVWLEMVAQLPGPMTLAETADFLATTNESDQDSVLKAVLKRLDIEQEDAAAERRIRILTMHGAKGLKGEVVFIPCVEQGVMPSFKAIGAAGLLIEARRLFYVSLTRAMAACIITHPFHRSGATAQRLVGKAQAQLARSQFLSEMHAPSHIRNAGLSVAEAGAIAQSVSNL